MASIILVPTALVLTFGHHVKDLRQGHATPGCMLLLFYLGLGLSLWTGYQPDPALAQLSVERDAPMEGEESRFSTAASTL